MATVYETLRDKILAKLQTITKFGSVYAYPKQNFEIDEYPVCIFYPAPESDVDFETTVEDERTYQFIINIFYQIKPDGIETALNALYNLVDDVMDIFSQDRTFSNIPAISMPSGTVYLMTNPVSAGWGQISEKDLIVAVIKLYCRVSVQSS